MRLFRRNAQALDLVDFIESGQMQIEEYRPDTHITNRAIFKTKPRNNLVICACETQHRENDPCPCCGEEP